MCVCALSDEKKNENYALLMRLHVHDGFIMCLRDVNSAVAFSVYERKKKYEVSHRRSSKFVWLLFDLSCCQVYELAQSFNQIELHGRGFDEREKKGIKNCND